MKHTLSVPIAVLLVLGGFALSSSNIYAQTSSVQQSSFIQRISQRFGLKESDVQSVFDEMHKERQAQRQVEFENRLNALVIEGKITQKQKEAILSKHKEMQEKRDNTLESMKNLTPQERKEEMMKIKQELTDWANEQGIDSSVLPYFGRMGKPMDGHMGKFR